MNDILKSENIKNADEQIDLQVYLRIVLQYKWKILGLALSITLLVAMIVFSLQPIYRASSTLLIEQKQAKVVTIQEVYDLDGGNKEYLQTQFEILKSRQLAKLVVEKLQLDKSPIFFQELDKKNSTNKAFTWSSWVRKEKLAKADEEQRMRDAVNVFMMNLLIEPIRGTQLVKISYDSTDPEFSALVSQTMAQTYIDSQMEARVQVTENAAKWLTERLSSLKDALALSEQKLQAYREKNDIVDISAAGSGILALNAKQLQDITERVISAQFKLAEVSQRYAQKHPSYQEAILDLEKANEALRMAKKGAIEVTRKEFKLQELLREVETNRNLYDTFFARIKEANQASQLETPNARIIDPAVPPQNPVKPLKKLLIILAFVLSIILGVILAFLVDYLDRTFKGSDDVESRLGVSLLGLLPLVKRKTPLQKAPFFLDTHQHNFSESVRTIRTGIMLSGVDNPPKVIVITSSVPGEGKTTLGTNLALALGQMEKVLLIDADMRRAAIAKALSLPANSVGLSSLVAGAVEFEQCVYHYETGNIDILTAGILPPNPLELLSSQRFKDLLLFLSEKYDRIIIDSAPTLPVSDSVVLATLADAVIYVVKSDSTTFHTAKTGIQKLSKVDAKFMGVVLNQIDVKKVDRYGGDYGGYYGYYGSNPE